MKYITLAKLGTEATPERIAFKEGEIFGIVGESGCGKSGSLRIPQSGQKDRLDSGGAFEIKGDP